MTAGLNVVTGALNKVLGTHLLRDVQTFVAAFDTLFGGFRQRAQRTFELLQAPETAFLVVAAPEPDALREAAYFVERLNEERMPLAGLIVNRVSPLPDGDLSGAQARAAAEKLERTVDASSPDDPAAVTAALLRLHADRAQIVDREARLRQRFAAAHPEVPTAVIPALATDVHDLDGLRVVGDLLTS
jgi:anion-transporting  ArsA/GET3 family ATPase